MNNRAMFPNVKLLKREIAERFLIALRDVFTQHPIYTYDEDDFITKVLIYPSYADILTSGKQPKIMLKPNGYNFTLSEGLYNEFAGELTDEDGKVVGALYRKMLNMSATILVQAYAEEQSADLADELTMMLLFSCRERFAADGLLMRIAQVGETDMIQSEQGIYQTLLNVSFDFPWVGRILSDAPTLNETLPEIELPEQIVSSEYIQPGIEVFRQKIQQWSIMNSNE